MDSVLHLMFTTDIWQYQKGRSVITNKTHTARADYLLSNEQSVFTQMSSLGEGDKKKNWGKAEEIRRKECDGGDISKIH